MYLIITNDLELISRASETEAQIIKIDSSYDQFLTNSNKNLEKKRNQKDVEKDVAKFLSYIGIPQKLVGYSYLQCIFKHFWLDPDFGKNGITKEIYPTVAKELDTTPQRVERGVRYAIELAWGRGSKVTQNNLIGHTLKINSTNPTNAEFIYAALDYFKREIF